MSTDNAIQLNTPVKKAAWVVTVTATVFAILGLVRKLRRS